MPNSTAKPASSLPPFRQLLNDSWKTFVGSIQSLFFLNVAVLIVAAILLIVGSIVLLAAGGDKLLTVFANPSPDTLTHLLPTTMGVFGVVFVVFLIAWIVIGTSAHIASLLIVGKYPERIPLATAFSQGSKLILPLLLVNFLSSLLVVGGLFVFFIPGLLIAILLMFASYEVIFENRGIDALKRSATLVGLHFGEIFLRGLFLFVVSLTISMLPQLGLHNSSGLVGWLLMISWIFSFLFGWYALAYMVTLYKQVKAVTNVEKETGIGWMWLAAVIGWVLLLATISLITKVAQSTPLRNRPQKSDYSIGIQVSPSPRLLKKLPQPTQRYAP